LSNFKNRNTNKEIKEMVRQKYSEIALLDQDTNANSCCGSGGYSTEVDNIVSNEYNYLQGSTAGADLKLGYDYLRNTLKLNLEIMWSIWKVALETIVLSHVMKLEKPEK
jgi:bacterioferritin-associated ferredoxin